MPAQLFQLVLAGLAFAAPIQASAAASSIDGRTLGWVWAIPFVGILLSVALLPLLKPAFWARRFKWVSLFWALAFALPAAFAFGAGTTFDALVHTALLEYFPFILLLFTLFVVAGGILVTGNLIGTAGTNTSMLAFGTGIASLIGTTGASMILIRPMIRANADRRHNVHVFMFFIFLVSNIGGSLTPLGDPPLFLGFLKGVGFLWTVQSMFWPMMLTSAALLVVFYLLDRHMWSRESEPPIRSDVPRQFRVEGAHNVVYLAGVLLAVLASGVWDSGLAVRVLGTDLPVPGLVRDAMLIVLAALSLKTTRQRIRTENAFTWHPIQEVAILFAAIFVTIVPVLAMLAAGREGAFAPLVALVTSDDGSPVNAAYFWLTGALSAFLDNAPTYLVFFNLAGGNAEVLMTTMASTLTAISAGAVFMGALTYIGNAPNFMVKAICEERKIRMPSFFGYMLWSGLILLPVFVALTFLFFR
ncbi:MAG TPA: sodium:proton antiporter [Casimicrobiaceae bacterium]|nr:sodium:proton antiporter [Casimicrobiaceae bacterium]